ncbi:MAG TPA: hypothetical protein DD473_01665 [Planctomycetaceae bacterium]|nr:hypothetical protein [Planctomycetaceae bacterium]
MNLIFGVLAVIALLLTFIIFARIGTIIGGNRNGIQAIPRLLLFSLILYYITLACSALAWIPGSDKADLIAYAALPLCTLAIYSGILRSRHLKR